MKSALLVLDLAHGERRQSEGRGKKQDAKMRYYSCVCVYVFFLLLLTPTHAETE